MNKIFFTSQSVFDLKDLSRILAVDNYNNLKSRIAYYVKKGYLFRIRKGIFVKQDFSRFELACKIYSPSYISFETVLLQEGIIYQEDTRIYLASYISRNIDIEFQGKTISLCYRKIKGERLYDLTGILSKNNYSIASPERAIEDMKYIKKDFYFDNLKQYG